MAERRQEGVHLLQSGDMSQVQIVHELGISRAAVSRWKKKLEQDGPQALQLHQAGGRPTKLDEAARQALVKKLEAGAIAAGFPTEQWTQGRVRQVIAQEFGVVYHPHYISALLHQMGWSVQNPIRVRWNATRN